MTDLHQSHFNFGGDHTSGSFLDLFQLRSPTPSWQKFKLFENVLEFLANFLEFLKNILSFSENSLNLSKNERLSSKYPEFKLG